MRLIDRITTRRKAFKQPPFWANEAAAFHLGGTVTGDREWIENNFDQYVEKIYKDSGVVFACIATRMLVFSEARLMWQELEEGRPGNLVHGPELGIFENPWPGGETGNLLTQMEADVSLAGNAFHTYCDHAGVYGKSGNKSTRRIVRMRPDATEIIIYSPSGNPWGLDAMVAGYRYKATRSDDSVILLADEVSHYAPYPDPNARFRGMSWVTPILNEIQTDRSFERHKKSSLDNGATLNHVVSFPAEVSKDDFKQFVSEFKASHQGFDNANKTLFLAGGVDVTPISVDFKQLEMTQMQGHGETRVAAAAGTPPVIVGLSEGLQAATYSNYGQARRRFADGTMRPLWRIACAALSKLVDVPANRRLWYDDRDIAFLRDDRKDEALILQTEASTLRSLIESGWEPESAKQALKARDMSVLHHTGKTSVQLQAPMTEAQQQEKLDGKSKPPVEDKPKPKEKEDK